MFGRKILKPGPALPSPPSNAFGKRVQAADSFAEHQPLKKAKLPYTVNPERERATSSLSDDRSDGRPYVSRDVSFDSRDSSIAMEEQAANEKSIHSSNNPTAPIANMHPQFEITGRPAPAHATTTFSSADRPSKTSRKAPISSGKTASQAPELLTGARSSPKSSTTPMEDVRGHALSDEAANPAESEEKDGFYPTYRALLSAHQEQSKTFELLHTEHAKSLKRVTNTASRRKQRTEQLERENLALRRSLGKGRAAFEEQEDIEEKLLSTRRTVEMLTKDLASWETKYGNSQTALRAITEDATTFERKWAASVKVEETLRGEIAELKDELAETQAAIKNGSKQLRGLQRVLRKVDRTVIERVRELARLSGEWDKKGGADDRLRAKVASEMTELVKIWRQFEEEYDEGVIGNEDKK